jgi:hypothetical protein
MDSRVSYGEATSTAQQRGVRAWLENANELKRGRRRRKRDPFETVAFLLQGYALVLAVLCLV